MGRNNLSVSVFAISTSFAGFLPGKSTHVEKISRKTLAEKHFFRLTSIFHAKKPANEVVIEKTETDKL